jgi:hypothetical protein
MPNKLPRPTKSLKPSKRRSSSKQRKYRASDGPVGANIAVGVDPVLRLARQIGEAPFAPTIQERLYDLEVAVQQLQQKSGGRLNPEISAHNAPS